MSRCAIASPMPVFAPVTRATFAMARLYRAVQAVIGTALSAFAVPASVVLRARLEHARALTVDLAFDYRDDLIA